MKTFIIFVFFHLFIPLLSLAVDIITTKQPLTINQTLVSKDEVFELGFINPGNNNLYIAIWYKQIKQKTYVWVANRDTPVTSSSGKLKIDENGNIVLLNQAETTVWSSNLSVLPLTNTVAQLMDNGNLVLREENDENTKNYIWQSFDYPTDTLLPGMKLGWDQKTGINRFITSWKSNIDPSTGNYSYKMNLDGFPEIFILNKGKETYRTGPWNGRMFSGVPVVDSFNIIGFEFENNRDEIWYSFKMMNNSISSRLIMSPEGLLQRFVWVTTYDALRQFWAAPRDKCDYYGNCGPFGVCDLKASPVCKCMRGFRPKNEQAWKLGDGSSGCVRSSELDCGSDGFFQLEKMKLPDTSKVFVNQTMSLSQCGEICKRNCSCSAYASMNITGDGSGCVIWEVDLMDMRQFPSSEGDGQDLYVRVVASKTAINQTPNGPHQTSQQNRTPPNAINLDPSSTTRRTSESGSTNKVVIIVAITIGTCVAIIIALILIYCKRRKTKMNKSKTDRKGKSLKLDQFNLEDKFILRDTQKDETLTHDSFELPIYEFNNIVAVTDNFKNKLGEGGFGAVYKGMLDNGQQVAVKRLSGDSGQGIEEFKNEIMLISKLQHRNLVKLLGCCIEGKERLLIYEFLINKSLDTFLFDPKKRQKLDWETRFNILQGIGRGLIYLHRDSCLKIIHRDLKCSNILLDEKMNPKISDFGLARNFQITQELANTHRIVGTYGCMSPEYAMGGVISEKSDVFSYGVMLLEIMSGKRNTEFIDQEQVYPLAHAWKSWKEGRGIEITSLRALASRRGSVFNLI